MVSQFSPSWFDALRPCESQLGLVFATVVGHMADIVRFKLFPGGKERRVIAETARQTEMLENTLTISPRSFQSPLTNTRFLAMNRFFYPFIFLLAILTLIYWSFGQLSYTAQVQSAPQVYEFDFSKEAEV